MTDLDLFPRSVSNFKWSMLNLSVVRRCLLGAVFFGAAIGFISNCDCAFSHSNEGWTLVRGLITGLRERRDRRLSAEEQDVWGHLRPCVWRRVVNPFRQQEVVDPGLTFLENELLEVPLECSILTLDVPLALWPVGDACTLVDADCFADVSQRVVGEFAAIVAGEDLWRAEGADEVLKRFDDAIGRFVAKFVVPHEPGENVLEDEDVPVPFARVESE